MVNTEGRLSDVPSDKIKGRIRKKHKTDVIKIIEPEDCVVAPNIPHHTDGCSTQEFIHQPFEFESSTQPREKLTLSPSKVPDEIFKKRVQKKKIDSETKMSSNHKKRSRGAGPKRKLSLSSESEVEGTDSTERRMRRKSAPLKTPTMVTCNACLKEMTQTEYRRHNRLPHEQECTVPGCTLRFSDKADLQHHRRTAHFLANSNRKSWVSSAMDQCHVCDKPFKTQKKLFAHLLLEHDISEGDQMFTASQEDLTEQIKLSDEVLVIPKVEIKQDQIQVKLEKEKPENDSKEELQMSEKKRRRSSKKERDPITEGLFKVEEDFKPMLNQPIKNNAFYAQLKEEGIKECPTCLFYFEENVFEKHFKKDHNIPCSVESCHLKFHLGSFEMSHFYNSHPGIKAPVGKQPSKECSLCGQGIDGKSIHSHVKSIHSEQCPQCNFRFVSNLVTYCSITNHRVLHHILPTFSSSIASESCPLQTIEPIQQSFENDEVFIESLPSTSTATEVNTDKIKKKRGRPSRKSLDEKILPQTNHSPKDEKLENNIGKITIKYCKVTNKVADNNTKANNAIAEATTNHVKQETNQPSQPMNEDNLNKNKGRPKKKRSKSAQEGRSDVKKLKVDEPPGTNTVGQARRLNQYGRRSQDGNLHQGLREMLSLSPKKEICNINFDDIQDYSVSSTIDETDLITNPVRSLSPSYSPESTSVHSSFAEDIKCDIKFPVDNLNQLADENVPGTSGQSRRPDSQNLPETFKQSSKPVSQNLPGTSRQSTSSENLTNQINSPFPGINVIPNIGTLNSAPNIGNVPLNIKVEVKSEFNFVSQENVEMNASKNTVPTQTRHPFSLLGGPLVPYSIDSESELSSLEDDVQETIVDIPEKSSEIKQKANSDQQKSSILRQQIKKESSNLRQQEVETALNEEQKSFSNKKGLVTSVKSGQIKNKLKLDNVNSIEPKEYVDKVKKEDLHVSTDQSENINKEFVTGREAITIDNTFDTLNDTLDNMNTDLEQVNKSKTETAFKTTNQNVSDLSLINSLSTNKDSNGTKINPIIKTEGTKSSKIRIKFNQQKGKNVPLLQLTEIPSVTSDQEYLTSVSDIEKEKEQKSLVSKIHLFEESEVVELPRDDAHIYQNNDEDYETNETAENVILDKEVNTVSMCPLADTDDVSFEVLSDNEGVGIIKVDYYTSKDNMSHNSNVNKEVDNQLKEKQKDKVVAKRIGNAKTLQDSADIISILDDIKKAANTSCDIEIINEVKKQKRADKGAREFSNLDKQKELGKVDVKIPKQTNTLIDKTMINQVNTSRPSVIMSTKSLISANPVPPAPDMAKIISSLPKIPKKERSSPSPGLKRITTPNRRGSKDIDLIDNSNRIKEKHSEIKPSTTKQYSKEMDNIEENSFVKEKPIVKKRGRPKKGDIKTNKAATDSVRSTPKYTETSLGEAHKITSTKEEIVISDTSTESNINSNLFSDANNKIFDLVKQSLIEKESTPEKLSSKNSSSKEKVEEIEVTKDDGGADDFDLFSQLDDLEKSIREEERDSKGNSDNERSIVDVNDFSNINPVETDDKNVAYEEINVSGDSVMEVEPDVNEEQSIEAIQELIKSSQRIDGKKYVPEIPEKSESLSIHKTSSKHDLDSDDDELGKFSPLSLSPDVPKTQQDEDSKSADLSAVEYSVTPDNDSTNSADEDEKNSSNENMESISAFIFSQSSRSEPEVAQNKTGSQLISTNRQKSNEDIESISAFILSESVAGNKPKSPTIITSRQGLSTMKTDIGEQSTKDNFRPRSSLMNINRTESSLINNHEAAESTNSRLGSSLSNTSKPGSLQLNTSRPGSSLMNTTRPGSSQMNLTKLSDGDGIIDDLLAESDEDDSELAEKPYISLRSDTKTENLTSNISKDKIYSNDYSNKSSNSLSYNFVPFGFMPESFRALSVSTSKLSNNSENELKAIESCKPITVGSSERAYKPESPLKSLTPKSSNIELPRKMSTFESPRKSLTPEKIGRVSSSSPAATIGSPFRSLTRPSTPSSAKKKKKKKHTKKKCPICELEMKVIGEYDAHVKQDHSKACPYCHLKFTYNHGLEDHIASQHNMEADICNSAAWLCIKCDKSFTREKKFKSHAEKLHKYRCVVKRCKMAFVLSSDLSSHIANGHSKDKGKTEKVKAIPDETLTIKAKDLPKSLTSSPILPLPESTSTSRANLKSFTIPKTNAGKKGISSSIEVAVSSSTLSDNKNDNSTLGVDTSGDEEMMLCEFCKMRFQFEEFMEHSDLKHDFVCSDILCGLSFVHEDTKLEHEFNAHGLEACTAVGQGTSGGYSTGQKRQTRKVSSSQKINDDDLHYASDRDTSLDDLLGSPQFNNDQEPSSEVISKKKNFTDSMLIDCSSANVSYDERASVSSVNVSRSFDAVEYLESDMARKYRKQLQCYQCDAQFKNKGDYERHMEYEHDEEPSNIPSSPEPEKQDEQEGEDTSLEPAAATQLCHVCHLPTEDLIGHLKLVHSESKQSKMVTQSSCNHCGVKFCTPLEYHKHAEIKHSFPCKGCKMTFIMETDLKAHAEKVHGSKTDVSGAPSRIQPTTGAYTCEFCGKENSKRANYDRHIAKLHNVECTLIGCEKMFVQDIDLKQHLINDHGVRYIKIGDSFEAKLTPGRSKLNAKIMDEAERWIACPVAMERMRAIIKGQLSSKRHELFFNKNEREQCNGRSTSYLHNLSNGRFFGDLDCIETNVIENIRQNIVEPMVKEGTADKRLIELFEVKEQSLLYTSLVMCPETFIHLCEAKYKMKRIEAENQFLEVQIDKEELENMRKGATLYNVSPCVSPRRDPYAYTSSESDGDSDNMEDFDTD